MNKEIKYLTKDVHGITNKTQRELGIYNFIEPYMPKKTQSYTGENKKIFDKETAIEMLFEYFYNNKGGPTIAKENNINNFIGFGKAHGSTRVHCGLKASKGKLAESNLSSKEAKDLIAEVVEYVYTR